MSLTENRFSVYVLCLQNDSHESHFPLSLMSCSCFAGSLLNQAPETDDDGSSHWPAGLATKLRPVATDKTGTTIGLM